MTPEQQRELAEKLTPEQWKILQDHLEASAPARALEARVNEIASELAQLALADWNTEAVRPLLEHASRIVQDAADVSIHVRLR